MSGQLVELYEYESQVVPLSVAAAERVVVAAQGGLGVEPTGRHGMWRLSATSQVGSIVTQDVTVLIRPKIRPDNLFLLLEVGVPKDAWRRESFRYATDADLLPSVVAFYARTLETVLARGLLRSYRQLEERLVALRGRLDLTAQFRHSGIRVPVACRFDEYTEDTDEHRYLKAATRLALRVPGVMAEDRRRLHRQLVALEEVGDVVVQADDLDRIPINRLNAHYEPALRLARLLLANLTLLDRRGDMTATSFLVDMNQLFEDFVTERLRRALRGRMEVEAQYSTYLATGRQVSIRPDLLFRRRGDAVLVGDIKYKLTGDARGRTSDYFQLLAYTTALDLPEGVLIYCLADGGRPERSVTVRHAGKILHTLAVDLSGSVAQVEAEIDRTADWLVERSRSVARVAAA